MLCQSRPTALLLSQQIYAFIYRFLVFISTWQANNSIPSITHDRFCFSEFLFFITFYVWLFRYLLGAWFPYSPWHPFLLLNMSSVIILYAFYRKFDCCWRKYNNNTVPCNFYFALVGYFQLTPDGSKCVSRYLPPIVDIRRCTLLLPLSYMQFCIM